MCELYIIMGIVNNPPIVKQGFTANMNYFSSLTDSDTDWIVCNNDQYCKMGVDSVAIDDTASPIIRGTNQAIIRSAWFLAPFDMTVTNISGMVMDDDMSSHTNMYYMGIWVMAGFGSSGDLPGEETGTVTLTLKYVTQDYGSSTGGDAAFGFYDSSPSLSLSEGDAVWAGHLNKRFDGADAMTLNMTLCAEKD